MSRVAGGTAVTKCFPYVGSLNLRTKTIIQRPAFCIRLKTQTTQSAASGERREMLFVPPKVVGLVLDLSPRQYQNKKLIDLVKKQLIEFVGLMTEEDAFYLFRPDAIEPAEGKGKQTAVLANYETDGYSFDLIYALKQTLFVTAAYPGNRTMVLISDRLNGSIADRAIMKVSMLNEKDDMECRLIIVSLCDKWEFGERFKSIELDGPEELASVLTDKILKEPNE
jgi:hypothetical protein